MCRFSGLKVFSEENLVKYRARNFEKNPEGSRREKRKNEKQIVAASYATRISAANL